MTLRATRADGTVEEFPVRLLIDTPPKAEYYRYGCVLNFVLRQLAVK